MTQPIPISCAHLIRIDWLKQSIVVFKSVKQARKELGDPHLEDTPGCAGWSKHKKTGQLLFWMMLRGKPDLGVIVHESAHIIDFIMEAVGIPQGTESTEVRAYMTEWLVTDLCSRYGISLYSAIPNSSA